MPPEGCDHGEAKSSSGRARADQSPVAATLAARFSIRDPLRRSAAPETAQLVGVRDRPPFESFGCDDAGRYVLRPPLWSEQYFRRPATIFSHGDPSGVSTPHVRPTCPT